MRLIAALAATAFAANAAGQGAATVTPPLPKRGKEALRAYLKRLGFRPLSEPGKALEAPERTLIIVLGDKSPMTSVGVAAWRRYFASDGALLLSSDEPTTLGEYQTWSGGRLLSVDFGGRSIKVPDRDQLYQRKRFYPFIRWEVPPTVRRQNPPGIESLRGALSTGRIRPLARVATNHPATLRLPPNSPLDPIGVLPIGSGPDFRDNRVRHRASDPPTLAAAGPVAGDVGWAVVLADPDVFNNDMLVGRDDVDNLRFTVELLRWLRDRGPTKRDRVLLYIDGEVESDFSPTVKNDDIPFRVKANAFFRIADRVIQVMEDRNRVNGIVLERVLPYRKIIATILGVLGVAALIAAVRRMRGGRVKRDRAVPDRDEWDDDATFREEQEARTLVAGSLTAKARAQVRAWFEHHGAGLPLGGEEPVFETDSLAIRRDLRKYWRFAYLGAGRPVTPERWDEMRYDLLALTRAADRGRWGVRAAPTENA